MYPCGWQNTKKLYNVGKNIGVLLSNHTLYLITTTCLGRSNCEKSILAPSYYLLKIKVTNDDTHVVIRLVIIYPPSFAHKWVSSCPLHSLSSSDWTKFHRKSVTVSRSHPIKDTEWFLCDTVSLATPQLCPNYCLDSAIIGCNTSTHTGLNSGTCLPCEATHSFQGWWEETATLKVSLWRKWIYSWAYFCSMKLTIFNFQVISQVIKRNEAISICKIPFAS